MVLRGKIAWAKLLGKPTDGYTKGEKEWSADFELDETAKAKYLKEGGSDFYIKSKDNHPLGEFLAFKRKEVRRDGSPAKPITVVDNKGQPWDPSVKIGNGSVVDVKFALNEVEVGRAKRLKPSLIAVKVVELVPYEGSGKESDFEDFEFDDENWAGSDE